MPEQTNNHGWTIPTVGQDNNEWGQILNDFFDNELEIQIILEDAKANRPSAGDTSLKYFHATDEETIYYNEGTSWSALAGSGIIDVLTFNPEPEPSTPETGDVTIYNDENDTSTIKAKFDDGSIATIAQK